MPLERGCIREGHADLYYNSIFDEVLMIKENEGESIERLAEQAEVELEEDYGKKDLKERRGIAKQNLFDGSKKLKHTIPKGKHI
jgi:hypothetical protein